MSFKSDIKIGKNAEFFVQFILYSADIPSILNESRNLACLTKFDIEAKLTNTVFTIETKFDKYESKSGNIAIEFYNPKLCKPSGIDATTADLWVHVLQNPTTAWVTRTDCLRSYIKNHAPLRTISCGGDKNSSMYLYSREEIFSKIFVRIDNLAPQDLRYNLSTILKDDCSRAAA